MLPNHSPLKVAESYKLLEAIHPGRIDLGIGRAPGTDGLTALALRRSRAALTADDFLEQLSELIAWGNGSFLPIIRSVRFARFLTTGRCRRCTSSDRATMARSWPLAWVSRLPSRDISVRTRPSLRCAPIAPNFQRTVCSTNRTRSSRSRFFAPTPRQRRSAWPRRRCCRLSSFAVDVRAACRARMKRCRTSSRRRSRRLLLPTRSFRSSARLNRFAPVSRTSLHALEPTK